MDAICHDCVLPTLGIIIDCIIDRMGIVTGGNKEHQSTRFLKIVYEFHWTHLIDILNVF